MTTEELKNAAGFKAVDAEGNELGVVSLSDIVSAVKQELQPSGVARASVAALSEVSAQAATDTYEDQLPQKTDVTWIRGLDESGNPILISKQSLVSVAEGLLGFPLGNKRVINKDTDLDNLLETGIYTVWATITSIPYSSAGTFIVLNGPGGLITQIKLNTAGTINIRMKLGDEANFGTWSTLKSS